MSNQHTTDEIFAPIGPPREEQAIRFIDIHIYEQEPEPEELLSVESDQEPEPATNESDQEHTESVRPPQKRRYIVPLSLGIICIIGISALVAVYLFPVFTPDATVTLVPMTQQIRTTTSITVTTGQATGIQLQGRALAALTMTQARTVATTGKGHQDAKAGQGYITFYNAATYTQTVTAGTILTGADGVQIVTDQDATIAAVSYPTLGQTTVAAHAIITGPVGNIAGGDIYGPCCRLNVSAVNSVFSGGQEARDYQTVTQQDITSVASSLKTSLNQSVQAALQIQVQSDETLIIPLPCQQSIKPDHQLGEEATQVNILGSETCTGMAYSTQAYQDRMMQIATQQATQRLGDGYIPIGQVQSTITQTTPQEHTQIALHINIAATYAYHVSQEQQQEVKTQVTGKSKAQAMNTLLHMPGIQSVSVDSNILPTDTKHIRVIIVYV